MWLKPCTVTVYSSAAETHSSAVWSSAIPQNHVRGIGDRYRTSSGVICLLRNVKNSFGFASCNCCRVCQTVALWLQRTPRHFSSELWFPVTCFVHRDIQAKIVFTDKTGKIPGRREVASVEQKSSCSWVRKSTMFVWVDCAVNGPGERLCQEDLSWGLAIILLHGGYRTSVNWRRNFNCNI